MLVVAAKKKGLFEEEMDDLVAVALSVGDSALFTSMLLTTMVAKQDVERLFLKSLQQCVFRYVD